MDIKDAPGGSKFTGLTKGADFTSNSSRTESFIIAPQPGQIDNVVAKVLLQTGQFIIVKDYNAESLSASFLRNIQTI
ncbi:MAG: hypothetical protein LUM44_02160 [Pyrinomonadaceae bacterium]|nr:hypothetical protein [Pyrinomonadaceae bacterium]